jgi:hypothetical protein
VKDKLISNDVVPVGHYSKVKVLTLSAIFIPTMVSILIEPIGYNFNLSELVDHDRWGWMWPFAALSSLLGIPYLVWLLVRVVLVSDVSIEISGSTIFLYFPYKRSIHRSDVSGVDVATVRTGVPLAKRIIFRTRSGRSVSIRIGLFAETADDILAAVTRSLGL